ncbi:Bug family tripartite tricarboxylate transporter substrate binding protein [Variovorax terrae]|uniref:Tripartite tricarboxylate transporter substrate binding protein n=1 Tax=Variovorax terrae TaxID=2923278 RepID=A0A9X1VVY8_9BURK|nr:tripartite tricarboxylate transporter substrate binding protein [Variovorax terrae]MCJ0764229.1 tripartite tricarboxylate transporter substrate binding protein [Variovorax terrae]
MKRIFLKAVLAAAAAGLSVCALAQDYPLAKPVTVIVPYGAGGGTDALARLVAKELGARMNQSFVVENVAGAGGVIGTQKAMAAPADGYTLLVGSGSELEITRLTDPAAVPGRWTPLAALGLIGTQPMVLVGKAALPFNTTDQLIEHLRQHPGSLSYASAGVGTQLHLLGELTQQVGAFGMVHVPYKSGAQIATDLVGGHVDLAVMVLPTVLAQIKAGKVKAFGVSDNVRSAAAPEVPTLNESRYLDDVDMKVWYGLFAPAGTPPAVGQAIARQMVAVLQAPEVKAKLADLAITPAADTSPAALAALKQSQLARIGKVIEATKRASPSTTK